MNGVGKGDIQCHENRPFYTGIHTKTQALARTHTAKLSCKPTRFPVRKEFKVKNGNKLIEQLLYYTCLPL